MIRKVSFLLLLSSLQLWAAEDNPTPVPLTWQEHERIALDEFDKGNIEAALSHFEKADLETDNPHPFHFNRGLCHRLLGETEQALKQFNDSMGSGRPLLDMDAHFQIGQIHYQEAMGTPQDADAALPSQGAPATPSLGAPGSNATASGNTPSLARPQMIKLDMEKLKEASFAFQEVLDIARRNPELLDGPHKILLEKAKTNVERIAAKYKNYLDQQSRERGNKMPIIQGDSKVNGRAVEKTRIYIKSKWDDGIMAHSLSDSGGGFKFENLQTGKYQLATALYDTDNPESLEWGEPIKVPTHEKDVQHLKVQGAITLACPYQSSTPSLGAPWDDHLRDAGPESIISSTDWGELCDGYPESHLPKDSDIDMAYVSFAEPEVQLVFAVPSQKQEGAPEAGAMPGMPNGTDPSTIAQSTEPSAPPTFAVTLMGYHDDKAVFAPQHLSVLGMKEGLDAPIPLYETTIQTTEAGLFHWESEEFAHQDCRNLILHLSRPPHPDSRMSLHEVEVRENLQQKKDEQKQENQDQKDQQQDQQKKDQPQDQKKEDKKEPQESRSTRAVLQKIREKNKEAKDKQQAAGMIYQTDKDY